MHIKWLIFKKLAVSKFFNHLIYPIQVKNIFKIHPNGILCWNYIELITSTGKFINLIKTTLFIKKIEHYVHAISNEPTIFDWFEQFSFCKLKINLSSESFFTVHAQIKMFIELIKLFSFSSFSI